MEPAETEALWLVPAEDTEHLDVKSTEESRLTQRKTTYVFIYSIYRCLLTENRYGAVKGTKFRLQSRLWRIYPQLSAVNFSKKCSFPFTATYIQI